MSPDSNGLVENVIDTSARRPLILVSKILQNLANNVEFGKKEPHMDKMNIFIRDNKARVEAFFDELAVTSY